MNIVVFSGGTATNSLTQCFNNIANKTDSDITYVLPISDNGGSTSEILRILGGPAIGDIRSRIVRIMDDHDLSKLFGYRLDNDAVKAKHEWNDIVDGSHHIWKDVPIEVKEICRAFIIHLQAELLKKSKSSRSFQFEKASIGNMFMTGARLFLGSLDACIELMMRIGRCNPKTHVIPCINTNHTHHISALLRNGDIITGQSQISHPSPPKTNDKAVKQVKRNDFVHILDENEKMVDGTLRISDEGISVDDEHIKLHTEANINEEEEEEEEFANPVYILPELRNSQLHFNKIDGDKLLPAPIERILYINPYGEEVKPIGNSRVLSKLKKSNLIIYSIGSLMTSLMPILILGNFTDTIVEAKNARKILIINNKYDRETFGIEGMNYVKTVVAAMTKALIDYRKTKDIPLDIDNIHWNSFVTDIIYLSKGQIQMDWNSLTSEHQITCHKIDCDKLENDILEETLEKISQSKL